LTPPETLSSAQQVKRLRDPDPAVRREALQALETCGPEDADAAPAIAMAVLHRLQGVEKLVHALGRIGPGAEVAVPAVVGLLGEPRASRRLAAAAALPEIGEPAAERAVPALSRVLEFDDDTAVREQAILALGRFAAHFPHAVEPLERALDGPDARERELAAEALASAGHAGRSRSR
jgi:hypothetical protein